MPKADFSEVNKHSTLLPPGIYCGVIETCEEFTSKAGLPMAKMVIRVLSSAGGMYDQCKVMDFVPYTGKAAWRFRLWLEAANGGKESHETKINPDNWEYNEFVGAPVEIALGYGIKTDGTEDTSRRQIKTVSPWIKPGLVETSFEDFAKSLEQELRQ